MNIYNIKNEMRREVYSKMLKKRQQKPSTRLYDIVVVREWMEYKVITMFMNLGPLTKGLHGITGAHPWTQSVDAHN